MNVWRPLAKLGQRDQTAVLRPLCQAVPLGQGEPADVSHGELGLSAEDVPGHDVHAAATVILPHDPGARSGHQFLRVKPVVHRARGQPSGPEAFGDRLGLTSHAGAIAHGG